MAVTVTRDPGSIEVAPRPQHVELAIPKRTVTLAAQGPQGPPGAPGPPGPTAVSADPGNTATLGSDSLIYVPDSTGARTTAALTTGTLAAGASGTGTIPLGAGYRLYRITTSAPCRVRLYTTDAKRTADAARPIGTDPTGDHGLMLEFVATAGLLAADLSPTVDGFDGKTTPDGLIPWSVTNTAASPAAITVTLTHVREEG